VLIAHRPQLTEEALSETRSRFVIEPLAPGFGYTSLDLHTRFLRPITVASGRLRCEGIVVNRTRQTALAESRLYDEGGRLVAHATSTCMIFPMPGV